MKKIYLAGPDVFKPESIQLGKEKKRVCLSQGFEGLYPLDNEISAEGISRQELAKKIDDANVAMIDQADGVIANLDPFRGPSADCGTVWECAYAKAKGIPVVGYSKKYSTPYIFRVIGQIPHDNMMVEDFGLYDNLMLVFGLKALVGDFHRALAEMKEILNNEEA